MRLEILNVLKLITSYILLFTAEHLYVDKKFTDSAKILRDLLAVDPSNKAVTKRFLQKLTTIESFTSNKNIGCDDDNNPNTDNKSKQSTRYSFTTSEVTDNRSFFDKILRESHVNQDVPIIEKPDTRYSFPASDIKYCKEEISEPKQSPPKQTWASIFSETRNKEGCIEFGKGNFRQAHKLYGVALSMSPNNAKYFTNRCECSIKLNNFKEALVDALQAIDIDQTYFKGYLKAINIFIILGEISQADLYIDRLKNNIHLINSVKFNEIPKLEKLKTYRAKIEEFYEDQNYYECLKYLNDAMKIATHCEHFENLNAECLVMVKQYDEAEAFIKAGLQKDPNRAYLVFVQGLKAYFEANLEDSINIFEQVLRNDRDFIRAINFRNKAIELKQHSVNGELIITMFLLSFHLIFNLGFEAVAQGQYENARTLFTNALCVDTTNKEMNCRIFYNRGITNFQLKDYKKAYADCTEALKINEGYVKALTIRAYSHYFLDELEDSLIDCEELLRLEILQDPSKIRSLVKTAKLQLQTKIPRSNFDVLGVSLNATVNEMRSAFKKLSLMYHSDKNPDATIIDQKKFKRKFQEIKGAYDSLRQSYHF